MEKAEIRTLIRAAFEGQGFAYAPYSRFHVGAALRAKDGRVFKGCNIENAGYTATNCAERTAIFTAVFEGKRDFAAIAVVGGKDGVASDYFPPCGVCRQVMLEFCEPDFKIYMGKQDGTYQEILLRDFMPYGFRASEYMK